MISRNSINGAYPIQCLGDVVEFLDSMRRPVTESERRAGPYPYYGANGQQGTIDDYIFDEPLVLLAEDGGHFQTPDRGIAYRISGKTWVNNHAHVLRPKACIDLAFLCRVLENYDVTPFVTGTTRGKLTKAGASEIVIPLPPLPEQRRIAEMLDRAEALRAKRRAALAQLDTLTQAIFLDMFGDPATNPKGFRVALFVDVCERIFKGAFDLKASSYVDEGIPFIRIADIQKNTIDLRQAVYISESTYLQHKGTELTCGDIVFSKVGTIDRIAVIPKTIPRCIISQNNVGAKLRSNVVHSAYALALLTTNYAMGKIRAGSKKAVQDKLVLEELRKLPFMLPTLDLQHEFARRVAAVDKLKTAHGASLAELDALFAALQHRAFRGEL
ncbi:restriction endonuclease subunit S [candidate division KSB1 bacterium]|nr:restriction endonuclease subunit S [candidate division KSB1 bacterium]